MGTIDVVNTNSSVVPVANDVVTVIQPAQQTIDNVRFYLSRCGFHHLMSTTAAATTASTAASTAAEASRNLNNSNVIPCKLSFKLTCKQHAAIHSPSLLLPSKYSSSIVTIPPKKRAVIIYSSLEDNQSHASSLSNTFSLKKRFNSTSSLTTLTANASSKTTTATSTTNRKEEEEEKQQQQPKPKTKQQQKQKQQQNNKSNKHNKTKSKSNNRKNGNNNHNANNNNKSSNTNTTVTTTTTTQRTKKQRSREKKQKQQQLQQQQNISIDVDVNITNNHHNNSNNNNNNPPTICPCCALRYDFEQSLPSMQQKSDAHQISSSTSDNHLLSENYLYSFADILRDTGFKGSHNLHSDILTLQDLKSPPYGSLDRMRLMVLKLARGVRILTSVILQATDNNLPLYSSLFMNGTNNSRSKSKNIVNNNTCSSNQITITTSINKSNINAICIDDENDENDENDNEADEEESDDELDDDADEIHLVSQHRHPPNRQQQQQQYEEEHYEDNIHLETDNDIKKIIMKIANIMIKPLRIVYSFASVTEVNRKKILLPLTDALNELIHAIPQYNTKPDGTLEQLVYDPSLYIDSATAASAIASTAISMVAYNEYDPIDIQRQIEMIGMMKMEKCVIENTQSNNNSSNNNVDGSVIVQQLQKQQHKLSKHIREIQKGGKGKKSRQVKQALAEINKYSRSELTETINGANVAAGVLSALNQSDGIMPFMMRPKSDFDHSNSHDTNSSSTANHKSSKSSKSKKKQAKDKDNQNENHKQEQPQKQPQSNERQTERRRRYWNCQELCGI